jgi:hypothetical protein
MPSSPSRESIIHAVLASSFYIRRPRYVSLTTESFLSRFVHLSKPRVSSSASIRGSRAIRDSALRHFSPNETQAWRDFIPASRGNICADLCSSPIFRGHSPSGTTASDMRLHKCAALYFYALYIEDPLAGRVRPRAITTTWASRLYGMWAELDKQRALA